MVDFRSETLTTLIIALVVRCAVPQTTGDFCTYKSPSMIKAITLEANEASEWSDDDACRCVVSPNFNSSQGEYRLLKLRVDYQYIQRPGEDMPHCLSMLQVASERKSDADINYPLGVTYDVCPGIGAMKSHTATAMVYKGQQFVFHIYNPGRQMITSQVTIDEFDGLVSVQCSSYERIMYEEDHCPCTSSNQIGWGGIMSHMSDFDEKRRLIIGLVTAFIFVAIIVAIIVGYVFYKRRLAKKQHDGTEAVTVENKAYQGSKQSVTSDQKQQPPEKQPAISFTPDPNLNLKLQQPTLHGSKDSGLASSNDNNDKRLPFMQPPPTSRSLDNINQMPVNYPPLAGQGSQSSLDHSIDPEYITSPAALQGKPAPTQDQPPNYPPLAGHGSQSSLDNPRLYPGDVDVLYAKPMKRRSPEYEKLNINTSAPAKEEQFHSAESLNASSATGHTDV